jgi:hypothetical protein
MIRLALIIWITVSLVCTAGLTGMFVLSVADSMAGPP